MQNYIKNNISPDSLITLFAQAPVGLALLKCDHFVVEAANEKMLELWGCSSDIISKRLLDVVPELNDQEFHTILTEVCQTGKTFREKKMPAKITQKEGFKNRYFDFIFSPVFDELQNIVAVNVVSTDITDQVLTSNKLVESEFKFKDYIINSEYCAALYIGRDLVIDVINDKMLETVDKTADIIGMKIEDGIPSLRGQHFIDDMKKVFDTGETFTAFEDKALIVRNGVLEEIYYDYTYQPVKNSLGEVYGVFNMAVDVTETVVARKKASENFNKLKGFIENVPMAIAVFKDEDFKLEISNKGANNLWGDLSPFYGKSLKEIFPEFESTGVFQHFEQVFNSGKEIKINEMKLQKAGDFDVKYLNYILHPTLDEAGKATSITAIAYDVTEELKNRKKLLNSEKKYKNLSDALPLIIFTTNPQAEIIYCNDRLKNYLGETVKDPIGEKFYHLSHPDDVEELKEIWQKAVTKKHDFEAEHRSYNTYSKEYNWLLTRAVPTFDEDGEISEWIGSSTNVNEFKLLENQKDTFLGIASHELKTPLTSLKIYAQLLERVLKKAGDEKNAAFATKMDAQVTKLNSLIGDLLDVTKITSGKMQLMEEEFIFEDLASEMVEELQLNAPQTIIFENKSGGTVFADKNRISQVMSNLISNAIKYSPNTTEIVVTSTKVDHTVEFCVQDFGIGMPADKKDRVFEQYYRVSGDEQHTFPGLGLGLYISAEIIERSKGKIWVNSILGQGSTFCFSLPTVQN